MIKSSHLKSYPSPETRTSTHSIVLYITASLSIVGALLQLGYLASYSKTYPTFTYDVSSSYDETANDNHFKCDGDKNSSNDDSASSSCFVSAGEKKFQEIEFLQYLGNGATVTAFKARYKGGTYVAKVTGDEDIFWVDFEVDLLHVLNRPPTIPNIPKLEFPIQSIRNPLLGRYDYLHDTLGVPSKQSKFLSESRRISLVVIEFVDLSNHHKPATIPEFRLFLRSFLETMAFVHSRNIMHFDLHKRNYHFDGKMVKIIDWNGSYFWEKDKILIRQPEYLGFTSDLNPPEAKKNESAVCLYPNSKDIWDVALLAEDLLYRVCKESENKVDCDRHKQAATEVIDWMFTSDPYKRPNATDLLQHPFFLDNDRKAGSTT